MHDPAGNLLGSEQNGGLVKGDRLLIMGDRHFQYDAAGNLIEERRGKGGQIVSRYGYDSDNRLIRAETPQGTSHYRYDALGRRIAKQTPQGETRFVYDGATLLQEIQNEQQSTYLFEPGSFRPLARIDQAGQSANNTNRIYYYHLDHLGTPREMTDATGTIVWSAQYRAYGNLALADVEIVDNPLRFQGQYHDIETGLHYNLNRHYDPNAGRFIHQDPIGLLGGDNLYQYVPNPTNWVDPWGLQRQPSQFNSFYDFDLAADKYFLSDSVQFRQANNKLIDKLNSDSLFRRDMFGRYPELEIWSKNSPNLSNSPPGLTWHHNEEPGRLNLVDRSDHSINHGIYHPTGKGGRDIWAGGKAGRQGKLNADGTPKHSVKPLSTKALDCS